MSPRLIMKLDVAEVRPDRGDVIIVSFRHPRRPMLPPSTAGAHVDLHLPERGIRQYSLCGDPADRSQYRVAIKREPAGRGGSGWLHENLRPGATLMVSAPRNHFELEQSAERYLLLAGGIGITPLLAMAQTLERCGKAFHLHDLARSRSVAPLEDEVRTTIDPSRVSFHFDDEPDTRIDLAAWLHEPQAGTQIYCCGPAGLMASVRAAASRWPEDAVRFEAFQPLVDETFVPEPFELRLRSTGATLPVPAERSALDVLRESGIDLPSSCEIGVCGSCECGFVDGSPVHRDVVLSPRARRHRFIPCVSRATGSLQLDL